MGDKGFTGSVAIPDPALAFVSMLRDALVKRGVKIDGRLRTVSARSGGSIIPTSLSLLAPTASFVPQSLPVEIASLQSPPFSSIAAHCLKPSQNQYAGDNFAHVGQVDPDQSQSNGRRSGAD